MRAKRSRQVKLVLLASTTALLAGCDSQSSQSQDNTGDSQFETVQEEVKVLKPGECAKVGLDENGQGTPMYSAEYCAKVEAEARADHFATAPRYTTREDCIREHGEEACPADPVRVQTGGSETQMYMPALGGMLVGAAAGIAAAHVVGRLTTPANGAFQRPVPVYQTLTADEKRCRANPSLRENDPSCKPRSGGGGGGARYVGGYSYGYGGQQITSSSSSGRPVMSYSRPVGGTVGSVTPGRASGFTSTARGGFGMSAGGHAGGGS